METNTYTYICSINFANWGSMLKAVKQLSYTTDILKVVFTKLSERTYYMKLIIKELCEIGGTLEKYFNLLLYKFTILSNETNTMVGEEYGMRATSEVMRVSTIEDTVIPEVQIYEINNGKLLELEEGDILIDFTQKNQSIYEDYAITVIKERQVINCE